MNNTFTMETLKAMVSGVNAQNEQASKINARVGTAMEATKSFATKAGQTVYNHLPVLQKEFKREISDLKRDDVVNSIAINDTREALDHLIKQLQDAGLPIEHLGYDTGEALMARANEFIELREQAMAEIKQQEKEQKAAEARAKIEAFKQQWFGPKAEKKEPTFEEKAKNHPFGGIGAALEEVCNQSESLNDDVSKAIDSFVQKAFPQDQPSNSGGRSGFDA